MTKNFENYKLNERYEVGRLISSSYFASTYECIDTEDLLRKLVIKIFTNEKTLYERQIVQIKRELIKINEEKICGLVKIFSFYTKEDFCAYVEEYLDDPNLNTYSESANDFSHYKLIEIMYNMAKILHSLHLAGIIHQNLHLNNIFIGQDSAVTLSDYSINPVNIYTKETLKELDVSLAPFYSPESLFEGKTNKLTDIYSFGMIAFNVLTKAFPYSFDNVESLVTQLRTIEPKPPLNFKPNCSAKLSSLILKCINKLPNNRFQDFSEIISELEKIKLGFSSGNISLELDQEVLESEKISIESNEYQETIAQNSTSVTSVKTTSLKKPDNLSSSRSFSKSNAIQISTAVKQVKKSKTNNLGYIILIVFLMGLIYFFNR